MSNPSKAKGTSYESAVCRYMREALGQPGVERRALHGSRDMGDLFGIVAHGHPVVAECKSHAKWGPADLAAWERQAIAERESAGAHAALLVVDVYRAPVARSLVFVTMRDLARLATPLRVNEGRTEEADRRWVCVTLAEACELMRGDS